MAGEATYASKPWLKSYDKGVPEKIQYEEICMPDILDRVAAKWPTRMALNFQGYTINYKGLNDMVCLLYTSPSPRDRTRSRMPSSA